MANVKISQLTAITSSDDLADADIVPIVDSSDSTTKRAALSVLCSYFGAGGGGGGSSVWCTGTNTVFLLTDCVGIGTATPGTDIMLRVQGDSCYTGDLKVAGDVCIGGDDLFMGTNTSGHMLVADGNNFNPVAMSGDIGINGSGVTTIQAGAVENSMLAGSIANDKLSNSSVSYGGISLSLGGTDATPAFNLCDATGYKTTNLVGTITNDQLAGSISNDKLAGSIANSKLANDSVSYGGVEVDLGSSDATPAFNLCDATGYQTSNLAGTITNSQLAGSIANDKLAGSIANDKLTNSSVSYGGVSVSLGGTDASPAFNLCDATGYQTSNLVGTITNAQLAGSIASDKLAGSIANSKLANSSVSYGGVSVSLGGTDATPAFNLCDATGYPTSSLVGTITSDQLAGSIANSKLANDSVSYGGIELDLGTADATPAFNLCDATGYKTTSLAGTITNAQLAGSISNDKLAGSIANSKLSNSSVSYGGVELALGATDATPAFNLCDATAYQTSNLVGTITNAQLAGSIANDKLAGSIANNKLTNDSVSYGGVEVDLGAADASPAFNLCDATGYKGDSALVTVGTITTGVWNGTAIANANLANSTVSYGGISVALGATDDTPAFNLCDATGYQTSNLAGTITNAQLAGSIVNSKLSNDSVSYGGIELDLGTADATPAFNLCDATGYKTSNLAGTITNAQLAGSIANDKLAGSIANAKLSNSSITVCGAGSNSTAISLGGAVTFAGTSNEIEVAESSGTLTIGLPSIITGLTTVCATNFAGTLATAAQTNVTSLGTLTALTVDNVSINGATIGHTDDTDLVTLADGVLTVSGRLDAASDIKVDAIRRYSDSSTTTKILLNDEVIKLHAGHASNEVVKIESGAVTIAGNSLTIENTSTNSNPFIQIKNDAREYNLQVAGARSDNFEIYDNTAGTQRLAIDSSGNVGIGTATPSHKLHVFGSINNGIKVNADTDTDFAPDSGYANDALTIQNSTAGNNNPVSLYFSTGSNGEVRFSAIDDASNGDANLALTMRRSGGSRCYVQFWEAGTGNVGIGTAAPTSTLHIQNNTANSYPLEIDAADGSNLFGVFETSGGAAQVYVRDASANPKVLLDATGDSYFTGGSVGIGTNNPQRILHLQSSGGTFARFTSENTDDFSVGANTNGFVVYNETDANYPFVISNAGCVGIGTTAPVAAFHLNNGASVTNLPANTRAVFANTNSADAITRVGIYAGGASAFSVLDLGRNDANCRSSLTYNTSADSLTIGTAGAASAAIINTDGRLGIGTQPRGATFFEGGVAGTLQVEGTSANTSSITLIRASASSGPNLIFGRTCGAVGSNVLVAANQTLGGITFQANDGTDFVGAALIEGRTGNHMASNCASGELRFYTNAGSNGSLTVRSVIDEDGNVLIGYTASNGSYKLQVNSQIFATNATIATSDGRYKEDVQTLSNATDLVSCLNPVQFKWKSHDIHNFNTGKTDIGFIAQEVQEVLSDTDYNDSVVVSNKTDDEEYLGLAESKMIPLLTKALQEAITKIETLETKVAALETIA